MRRAFTALAIIVCGQLLVGVAQQSSEPSTEIALVANAEDGTVALVDVAARAIVGTIDVNPARAKSEGPGAPNYAQDTDVSPDGRTLYVSRGYLGDVAAFDIVSGQAAVATLVEHRPRRPHDADRRTGEACSCRR